jgi:hypothetical protein
LDGGEFGEDATQGALVTAVIGGDDDGVRLKRLRPSKQVEEPSSWSGDHEH